MGRWRVDMRVFSEVIYSLLDTVRAKEPLWNTSHKSYKSRNLKRKLMNEISKEPVMNVVNTGLKRCFSPRGYCVV